MYLIVDQSKDRTELNFRYIEDFVVSPNWTITLNITEIEEECKNFWMKINSSCCDDLSQNENFNKLHETTVMNGSELCNKIFQNPDLRNVILNYAEAKKPIIICTDFLIIPWGLLYFVEQKKFLQQISDLTIIPTIPLGPSPKRLDSSSKSEWGLIYDTELEYKVDSNFRDECSYFTFINCNGLDDLCNKIDGMKFINFIAHLESKGEKEGPFIRINKNTGYNDQHAKCYFFPKGSCLILSTCHVANTKSASYVPLAAKISAYSKCCVIASCCLLPALNAVDIAFAFANQLKKEPPTLSIAETWRKFQHAEWDTKPLVRFYVIYGTTNVEDKAFL
ncbi:MAG: hypothetical protein R3B95_00415 [Nitrospirales bacterium]|nr:hypothetical protein [Nitrospirales bacterium]